MLNKRQEIFKNAVESKLRVQSRESERLQDQIIEDLKEMEQGEERTLFVEIPERERRSKNCRAPGN